VINLRNVILTSHQDMKKMRVLFQLAFGEEKFEYRKLQVNEVGDNSEVKEKIGNGIAAVTIMLFILTLILLAAVMTLILKFVSKPLYPVHSTI
jgi:hypothetical protein